MILLIEKNKVFFKKVGYRGGEKGCYFSRASTSSITFVMVKGLGK
jgi:hypothetical protein